MCLLSQQPDFVPGVSARAREVTGALIHVTVVFHARRFVMLRHFFKVLTSPEFIPGVSAPLCLMRKYPEFSKESVPPCVC